MNQDFVKLLDKAGLTISKMYTEEKYRISFKGIEVDAIIGQRGVSIEPAEGNSFMFSMPASVQTAQKWLNVSLAIGSAAVLIESRLREIADEQKLKGGEQKNDGRNKKSKTRRAGSSSKR